MLLLFRGALYRQAIAQELTRVIQEILDQYTDDGNPGQLYEYSKALASDLNAAIHLHYEVYANIFDARYNRYATDVSVDLSNDGTTLEYRFDENHWYWENAKLNDATLKRMVAVIDDEINKIQQETTAVDQFLNTLVQHTTNWSIASHTDNRVQVEVDGAFVTFTRVTWPDTIMLRSIVAYKPRIGAGSKLLSLVTRLADTFCVTVIGSSSVYEPYGMPEIEKRQTVMTQEKLDDFYRSFGFKVKNGSFKYKPRCR